MDKLGKNNYQANVGHVSPIFNRKQQKLGWIVTDYVRQGQTGSDQDGPRKVTSRCVRTVYLSSQVSESVMSTSISAAESSERRRSSIFGLSSPRRSGDAHSGILLTGASGHWKFAHWSRRSPGCCSLNSRVAEVQVTRLPSLGSTGRCSRRSGPVQQRDDRTAVRWITGRWSPGLLEPKSLGRPCHWSGRCRGGGPVGGRFGAGQLGGLSGRLLGSAAPPVMLTCGRGTAERQNGESPLQITAKATPAVALSVAHLSISAT